jgi:hypothetical protein
MNTPVVEIGAYQYVVCGSLLVMLLGPMLPRLFRREKVYTERPFKPRIRGYEGVNIPGPLIADGTYVEVEESRIVLMKSELARDFLASGEPWEVWDARH